MPSITVHYRLTMQWAIDEGMDPLDAEAVGGADARVDQLWPGHTKWARHFNPTAALLMAPIEWRHALAALRSGDRTAALEHLGYSLHSVQDGVGHGRLGLSHLLYGLKITGRDPDDWEQMPVSMRARIERGTRRVVRRFLDQKC